MVPWTCGTMDHSIPSFSQMSYIFYWDHWTIGRTEGLRLQHTLPPNKISYSGYCQAWKCQCPRNVKCKVSYDILTQKKKKLKFPSSANIFFQIPRSSWKGPPRGPTVFIHVHAVYIVWNEQCSPLLTTSVWCEQNCDGKLMSAIFRLKFIGSLRCQIFRPQAQP